MCLYSKQDAPKISKRAIKCYKVLVPVLKQGKFVGASTPATKTFVPLDLLKGNGEYEAKGESFVLFNYVCDAYVISRGYIHCYTKLKYADDATNFELLTNDNFKDLMIVECLIPAGTKYYRSQCGREICAEKIKFTNKPIESLCV